MVSEKDFERILELSNIQKNINKLENPTTLQKNIQFFHS